MTLPSSPVPDSVVPENGQTKVADLIAEIQELDEQIIALAAQLQRKQEDRSGKTPIALRALTEQMPQELAVLRTRILRLGTEDFGKFPFDIHVLHSNFISITGSKGETRIGLVMEDTRRAQELEIIWGENQVSCPLHGNQNIGWGISPLLLKYPEILAWFQEQLAQMEDAKKAEELAAGIKIGE